MYNGPIDMNGLVQEDDSFEDIMRKFSEAIEVIFEAVNEYAEDLITTPLGQYAILTGPNPVDGGYETCLGISSGKLKNGCLEDTRGPVTVESYTTKEQANAGHQKWLQFIVNTPPAIMKDIRTGETIFAS